MPAAQTEIPRERATLKFKDEDAEAVTAKALEGRSDSGKEEALFPEPIPVPASLEIPGEAKKRDGGKMPSGEETPRKEQQVPFADEKHLKR